MKSNNKIPLVAVVGPTASGKTGLGIALAKKYNGEIISADSMQIYTGMAIATAKPTAEEMQSVPHHMIGVVDSAAAFSVAQYANMAKKIILDIRRRGKLPILVGGTGLYIDSLLKNITFGINNSNAHIREELNKRLQTEGAQALLDELALFDPKTAQRLDTGNGKRIVRAIEVYKVTGKSMTQHNKESMLIPSPYFNVTIGLTCQNRQNLYNRINQRVDQMLESGLIEEAKEFLNNDNGVTAAKAIGYKELEPYFCGEKTLEQAVDHLKRETRRYAKRQLTWFRRNPEIHWIYTDELSDANAIFLAACNIVDKSLNIR